MAPSMLRLAEATRPGAHHRQTTVAHQRRGIAGNWDLRGNYGEFWEKCGGIVGELWGDCEVLHAPKKMTATGSCARCRGGRGQPVCLLPMGKPKLSGGVLCIELCQWPVPPAPRTCASTLQVPCHHDDGLPPGLRVEGDGVVVVGGGRCVRENQTRCVPGVCGPPWGAAPLPPPCACTALSKHGVGVEPPF